MNINSVMSGKPRLLGVSQKMKLLTDGKAYQVKPGSVRKILNGNYACEIVNDKGYDALISVNAGGDAHWQQLAHLADGQEWKIVNSEV